MLSSQMVAWRTFVYTHNLYSIVGNDSIVFRDCSPNALRRNPSALHRIMDFANRDLSLLLSLAKKQLLEVFDAVQSLLQELDIRSDDFLYEVMDHLGPAADQFVHELKNFACSPYDSLISYDCNMKYSARQLTYFEVLYFGFGDDFELLAGVFSFPEYAKSCQVDENFDVFAVNVELEDEDTDVLDDYVNMVALQAPLFEEMRRAFRKRHPHAASQFLMSSPTRTAAASQTGSSVPMNPADVGLEMTVGVGAGQAVADNLVVGSGRSQSVANSRDRISRVASAPATMRNVQPVLLHRSPIQLRSRVTGPQRRFNT